MSGIVRCIPGEPLKPAVEYVFTLSANAQNIVLSINSGSKMRMALINCI